MTERAGNVNFLAPLDRFSTRVFTEVSVLPTTRKVSLVMRKPGCMFVARGVSWLSPILCATAISVFASNAAQAQVQASGQEELKINPTASDRAAAEEAKVVYRHARPANTAAGSALKHKDITTEVESSGATATSTTAAGAATPPDNDRLSFPADLSYLGGAVVPFAESHAIYLQPKDGKCQKISTCWR